MTDTYLGELTPAARVAFRLSLPMLRRYDRTAAHRVDRFLADSNFVGQRIQRYYGREATTLYPAVEVERFEHRRPRGDFFLLLGELVGYKRADLAIDACTRLGLRLVVAGDGPQRERLQERAGPCVEFVGRIDDAKATELLETCRAVIFPQVEDFGIVAVEAQAAGRPVIAFGAGGALETVVATGPERTGAFFHEQTAESLADVLCSCNVAVIDPESCRANAQRFASVVFRSRLQALLSEFRTDPRVKRHSFPDER